MYIYIVILWEGNVILPVHCASLILTIEGKGKKVCLLQEITKLINHETFFQKSNLWTQLHDLVPFFCLFFCKAVWDLYVPKPLQRSKLFLWQLLRWALHCL